MPLSAVWALAALAALLTFGCSGGGGGSPIASMPLSAPSPKPTPARSSCAALRTSFIAAAQFLRPRVSPVRSVRVGPGPAVAVCPSLPGAMHCAAWLRTDVVRAQSLGPAGYAPADLQSAYGLTAASAADGGGQIVAVVDAYDDPNAESDLSVYRSAFALPACTTGNGCFLKVNQAGMTSPLPATDGTGGWEEEESLDLDMVSAVCPNCKLVLVEAGSANDTDLYAAEDTAASTCSANVISDSWNGSEYASETGDEVHFNHPGAMIAVASGDSGYNNPSEGYPATSAYVTAVGGTTLSQSGAGFTETVWSGTGSRCSAYIAAPPWQRALGSAYTRACGKRIDNDVAAVADPNTGVATYDSFGGSKGCPGWCISGGTSAATPIIASVYALAANTSSLVAASSPYGHTGSLRDITSGSNGTCSAAFLCTGRPGYDAPSGNGTPQGLGAF